MGVLSKISVGDIFYYTVDDIPTHVAPRGSVAILGENDTYITTNSFTYINNNGGSVWLKCIEPKYGQIYLDGGTTTVAGAAGTAWNAFNPVDSWTLNPNSHIDFILSAATGTLDDLTYTGTTDMRVIASQSSTIRGATRWAEFETGVSYNFTVPTEFNGSYTQADDTLTINQQSQHVLEFEPFDYVLGARSTPTMSGNNPAQRTWLPKYCQVNLLKIDQPLKYLSVGGTSTVLTEDWESSGFTENSWTVVNDTNNQWIVGQSESISGTSSAYVSNDSTTATYLKTVNDVSHFYIDVTFPESTSATTMTFDWKCWGENAAAATNYDYGVVYITDTTTTPVAGSELTPTTQATIGTNSNGRVGATTNLGKFNEGYGGSDNNWRFETIDLNGYSGLTKRLVFTWKDDTSAGDDPPFVVDNIFIEAVTVAGSVITVY